MANKVNLSDAIEHAHASQRIGRSMVYTVCDGHCYSNGEQVTVHDVLLGRWSAERATRMMRKVRSDETVTVVHAVVYKQYCDMDLLDFWLNARATSDPVQVDESYIND